MRVQLSIIQLKNLPANAGAIGVQSLVWGGIPHAVGQLHPYATTAEPALHLVKPKCLEPVLCDKEKPPRCQTPATGEWPLQQWRDPSAAKTK